MAETDDEPRGLSGINPECEVKRRKIDASKSKNVLRNKAFLTLTKKKGRDIVVNNKTPFKVQLYKCEKLLDKGASELIIHGLGATVFKAVNLALQLKEIHHGTLDLDIKTSTIELCDKIKTQTNNNTDSERKRQTSGIHIRVFRKLPFATLRSMQAKTN
ncbi:ribonuclease P protein subunit p20 [Nylanderia fulva]|uniref:ribonuclease P protein subunit p20 n=1 Tax=Nylanderia fulva TaxID=613905 RepID=UPI0010FB60BD|nr:ribonuclease P protein subunit p20 [Nylanderia fulva]